MKWNLKNRPKLCHFKNAQTQPEITLKKTNEWFEAFEKELTELFKREHKIAEDNQDLYYEDKLSELEREILGVEAKTTP